ncbi:MAG: ABC transporter ATP-binding protein [Geminicoccaceae bacterium]|nr:ABC transporter ATP-binding protein [Geminicoccaceae bacterium]
MTAEALLTVENLTIGFRGLRQPLVDGVGFAMERGRTLCLVGESGCGKSLTALALMGLLASPPTERRAGRALFEGRDLFDLDLAALQDLRGGRIAMIFQEPMTSLNPAIRIGEQIAESIRRHQGLDRAAARRRALDRLEQVRIPAAARRLDDYPHQLSGGMRQRVMIAMALANDPALLIADEPTTALDVTIQAQILDLIRNLQSETGAALLLITHDLGVVAQMADEVAVMYAGRIVESGPARNIFDDPQHPYTLGLMGSLPTLDARRGPLLTIPGIVPSPERLPDGCRFADRCPFRGPPCVAVPALAPLGDGHAAACHYVPLEEKVA